MKKNYLFLLTVLYILSSNTDAQNFEWAKSFGGSSNEDGNEIVVDALGNVYTIGNFRGTVDFDPAAGTANHTSAGSQDIFVQKLDANGNFVWSKSFGGSLSDVGQSISLDALGYIYTTGQFQGTVDFNPGAGISNLNTAGGNDIFVQKLDANGNFIWAKSFGGRSNDEGFSTTVDASGNVFTTGRFEGRVDFDPGVGTANLTSVGWYDIFIQKLDPSGNFVWAKSFGGNSLDAGYSIKIDSLGNVYTTGSFRGTVDFNPGTGTANLSAVGVGNSDIFVQKLDPSGNFIWAKSFGGSSNDAGQSITVDASGNVYSTGYFRGTVDFDPGAGTDIHTVPTSWTAVFVQKLDASGNFVWAKTFGGSTSDYGHSITLDALGNVYTTGSFSGRVDFDPGAGTVNLSAGGNGSDVFVQKLDASGNFVWARSFGGSASEEGYSIQVDAFGNVYTTGRFQVTADFDPGAGTTNLTSIGGSDIFVHKMSQTSTTGIIKLTAGIQVKAYPNPSKGIVQIAFEKAFSNVEITLTDLQGKEVFSRELNATANEQIEIEGSPGVYFLSIRSKEGQSVIKLIKE